MKPTIKDTLEQLSQQMKSKVDHVENTQFDQSKIASKQGDGNGHMATSQKTAVPSAARWSEAERILLIEFWEEAYDNCRIDRPNVWHLKFLEFLKLEGKVLLKSKTQVTDKWKNMQKLYNDASALMEASGFGDEIAKGQQMCDGNILKVLEQKCPMFFRLHHFLSDNIAVNPPYFDQIGIPIQKSLDKNLKSPDIDHLEVSRHS